MEKHIYRVYDQKSQTYGELFTSVNDETAKREFQIAINSKNGMMAKYPEDFMLMEVGIDNQDLGSITAVNERAIVNGMHLVIAAPPPPFEMTNGLDITKLENLMRESKNHQDGPPQTIGSRANITETTPTNSGSN